ncbi:N-acetylglucosamine-6-phosphate deacetylase [Aquamicrobium sp. LC103]|uniref:N-acetylglucosamine-6-phosphate deacetylase n=1 Tax=Aquamicrobium sp. LC103 TaxID=1120658 RepID=UPI00063EB05E|nr:N-acetylglucosamine-6-phosphate deacetylase [Aquamicrobium sp. LC103]TKT74772.1 N-acetylglucosamine-6-phosphate deacetylase [Aquamicrobium sp. LC103]
MSEITAFAGARIFDGEQWHENAALIARGGVIERIVPEAQIPGGAVLHRLEGGILAPGFIDLQVNGGGGVMLNDRQDVEAIRIICEAHARFGTTALLPTLISDTPEVTAAAVEAGAEAGRRRVPGYLGLHLEGPHLTLARKGAHDPAMIRPMEDVDEAAILDAHGKVPVLLVTLAPEAAAPERVRRLSEAGVVVSLGHSDASRDAAREAASAGASMVTHLFNAMSQMGNREPGLVGAALDSGELDAGLIADGFHVDPAMIGIALRAKKGPGRIFLVTDAMATIGTDMRSFTLNGRLIRRENGRLTLEDGTLAGADLDMISAVRFVHEKIGLPLEEALRMASLYPARAMRIDDDYGRLGQGARADLVHLSPALDVESVWIEGRKVFGANG